MQRFVSELGLMCTDLCRSGVNVHILVAEVGLMCIDW